MAQTRPDGRQSRAIEALAQALYEAEDPALIAWAKRTAIVREPWILRARQQLKAEQEIAGRSPDAASPTDGR